MTTNERLNYHRYKHFGVRDGKFSNPFNFGIIQNLVDLVGVKFLCFKPTNIDWKREHDIQDLLKNRLDKKKDSFMV